jgi:hypothetical protein
MADAEADAAAIPLRCERCTRAPRDADDRLRWVTIDGDAVCPGCLTMSDDERLRDA